jgi:hypothetical protein
MPVEVVSKADEIEQQEVMEEDAIAESTLTEPALTEPVLTEPVLTESIVPEEKLTTRDIIRSFEKAWLEVPLQDLETKFAASFLCPRLSRYPY